MTVPIKKILGFGAVLTVLGLLVAFVTPSASLNSATVGPSSETLRTLSDGQVEGFVNAAGGHSFLGLRYAQAPVGPLRWHSPKPTATWSGVQQALAAGPACLQYGWPFGGIGPTGSRQGQEDCLFLNVYAPQMTPASAASAKLPVMVWVHGGSNTIGHAAAYDGSRLAQTQNVIVVMINYRIGPMGWFVMPRGNNSAAVAGHAVEDSGNWGTLDILESLHWVQRNIGGFGGDPGNVTVFGESAGATNALSLLVSPLAQGLMQRMIVQSLGFGFAPIDRVTHYVDDPSPGVEYSSGEILLKLLVQQHKALDRQQAKRLVETMSADDIAEFLRSLDPWVFYSVYHPSSIETAKFPTVFQDGAVIRQGDLATLLKDPALHWNIPVMMGTNRDEPKMFMAFDRRLVFTLGGIPLWSWHADAYDREAQYRSLLWKANGVDSPLTALVSTKAPVFAYRFDWRNEGTRYGFVNLSHLIGAAHGLEIPFVFGDFNFNATKVLFSEHTDRERRSLSDDMMSYWASFAATGSPGTGRRGELPEWPQWPTQDGSIHLQIFDRSASSDIHASAELSSREQVMALMEATEPTQPAACDMFRATFRDRFDDWADQAWHRYKGGYCESRSPRRYNVTG